MGNALEKQGKLEDATETYNKALAVKPDYAEAYNNMGIILEEQGKLEEAIEVYTKALAIKPDFAQAYNNMGNTLKEQGKLEEAIEAYNKALAIKPDDAEAKHMLAALIGETTNAPPREYVENLFDKYAVRFERSLVGALEYCIPRTLTDIILKQSSNRSLGSVLDLGCGTGLVGDEVKRFCENLEGIDLSKLMLEQARLKNVYDKLTHSDIIEYLSNEELNFDYFISTDVFIYVGNLTEVFRFIKSRNKRPGKLTFSTEHTEKDGFQLQKTGRYTHSKSYIEGLCSEFKYTISHFSMSNLRKEKDQFLTGGLYVLDF
jgi:predicted TPR repeat methyltransferase